MRGSRLDSEGGAVSQDPAPASESTGRDASAGPRQPDRGGRLHLWAALRGAFGLVWQTSPGGLVAAAMFQLIAAVTAGLVVLFTKVAVEALLRVQDGRSSGTDLLPLLLGIALITAIGGVAGGLQQQQERLLGERVGDVAWNRLLDVTGRVKLEYFESPTFFEELARIKSEAIVRPAQAVKAAFGLLGAAVGSVGVLAVLLGIEPLLVPVLVLGGVPALYVGARVSRAEFAFAARVMPRYMKRDYLRALLSTREPAKEIRAFGTVGTLRTRHDAASADLRLDLLRHVRRCQSYAVATVLAGGIALTAALMLVAHFVDTGRVGVAEAGAAVIGIRLLSLQLGHVQATSAALFESAVFLRDFDRFLALSSVVESPGSGTPAPHAREIVLGGVGYAYPGADRPALIEVDLRIRAGEVVALVGENGSGKTTLAKLIAGLYAPTEGRILWDGVDAGGLEPADIRRSVAVIFQDFVRYEFSALDNVALGDPRIPAEQDTVRAAARRAGADEFLDALPDGYATLLSRQYGEGHDLSGGQWQRVALARALYRNASLVVLDEPTAALDPRAEHALFSDLRGALRGRSALLISHRFSSVRSADRIYVLASGRVVESGTHEELIAVQGRYAELFALQAAAYR